MKYTALKQYNEFSDPHALMKAFEALGERHDVLPVSAPKNLRDTVAQNLFNYQDWYYGNPTGHYEGNNWIIAPWSEKEKARWNEAYKTALAALEEAEKLTAGQEPSKPQESSTSPAPIAIPEEKVVGQVPLWWFLVPVVLLASAALWWAFRRRSSSQIPYLPIPTTAGYDENDFEDCGCDGGDGLEGLEGNPRDHLATADHKLIHATEALKIANNQLDTERCETVLGTLMEIQGHLDVVGNNLYEVLEDPESSDQEKEIAERLKEIDLRSAISERDDIRSEFVKVCLKKRHGKRSTT